MNKRSNHHNPEQIVRKLCDVEAMLNASEDLVSVLQAVEVRESAYLSWWN